MGHKTSTRATTTLTHKEKRHDSKKTNISVQNKWSTHAQLLSHKHGRRWWTVKLQSPSISVPRPIQWVCLALTLPERLGLMTRWEKDRDTGEKRKTKGGQKREDGRGVTGKVERKKKRWETDSWRGRESHSVWLWERERKKQKPARPPSVTLSCSANSWL